MKRVLGLGVSIGLWVAVAACTQGAGPLKVDSLEPNQGTTAGGDEIAIVGGGFQPGKTQAEVKFGRKKAENVVIAAAGKIKVLTPANEKGPVDVTVMFDDGSMFKVPNGFRYVEPADTGNARRAFFSGGQPAANPNKIEIEKR
ncbi:MAG TPA: IPT/TIG domain-containing protein [Thermoanaerobaculia bacterium]|nr:IPT/TIG domain-containing protein [Thermoanaerobaculia bacterium]